ncbi:hypothetical protein DNTS_022249 [Danionella cerebrum]|uniref:RRM domain-containing protein n=1 Tax=Danionella cerebrum TaxID=2873325 RepID=A0A553QEJ6_9TELE|nr:hypothetical protein DNTS_022249 [Danionella translucida]
MPALTLFVRRLPETATNEQLAEVFSDIGPLKNCFVVTDRETKKCRGFGYVTFSMEEDALRAIKAVKLFGQRKIVAVVANRKLNNVKKTTKTEKDSGVTEEPQKPAETESPEKFKGLNKKKLKSRLIIRNLSFKCEESDLKKIFSEFGTVLSANIPLKPDGKKRGFGFVQFKNMAEAGKALAAMNQKEIYERPVAVDWVIPRDKFLATQSAVNKEDDEDSVINGADEKEDAKKKLKSESSEDEDDDDDSNSEKEEAESDSDSQLSDSEGSESNDDPDDDDDDDDEEDGSERKVSPAILKKKRDPLASDVNEGRTVFIRNLSYDTDEEGLEEVLQQFGELDYIRVVMNLDSGYSKGCAFAKFRSKEEAEKCIAASQDDKESGGIRVDGMKLNIIPAVNREDAAKFKEKNVKTQTGVRNMYLAREGLIRPGSKPAEGVSELDMAKRARFDEIKRAKLKDSKIYISKTRLCVHNLPKSVNKDKLFKLSLSAAGGKGVRITECRVMYDKKPIRGQVMGHSLGFGFVEFKEHEHALQALRHLNNNPDIFGPQKRPIVEFSLEDSRKLKLKATRLENSKKRSKPDRSQKTGDPQQPKGKIKGSWKKGNAKVEAKVNAKKQDTTQGNQFSGFMTKPEVEHVELKDGKKRLKVLHMPSHRGPKIRKCDKGKKPVMQPKKKPNRTQTNISKMSPQTSKNRKQVSKPAKRKFQSVEDTRFEILVKQYKKKLMAQPNAKPVVKKSKWFSS